MKAKNKISAILATLVLIVSVFMVFPLPVSADDTVVVFPLWTEPEGEESPALVQFYPLNKTGELKIMLLVVNSTTRTELLHSWELGFTYNPAVLKFMVVYEGIPDKYVGFMNRSGATTFNPGTIGVGNVTGINCTMVDPSAYSYFLPPEYCPLAGGLDVLATVVFMVVDYGASPIILVDGYWSDTAGFKTLIYFPKLVPPGIDGYFKLTRHWIKITGPYEHYLYWRDPLPPASTKMGENFMMPMSIVTSEDVHAWSTDISFNPDVLNCTAVEEGMFLKTAGTATWNTAFTIDNNAGTITGLSCALESGKTQTGRGSLAWLNFTAVGYGKSNITFTDFVTLDVDENVIAFPTPPYPLETMMVEDGYFEFEKLLVLSLVDESGLSTISWTYPDKKPGDTFNVYLKITDVTEHVNSWKAGFSYNPNVLDCTDLKAGTYFDEGTYEFTPGTVYPNGTVTASSCNLTTPNDYQTGPGILLNITFQVIGCGRTLIKLTDVNGDPCEAKIQDPAGNELVSTPPSGLYFVNALFKLREKLTVKLEIAYPTVEEWYEIGETIVVTLRIDNTVERVSHWMSGIHFDNTFLNCTGVVFGTYLPAPTYDFTDINNAAGYVSVGQSVLGAGFKAGSGILANITFEVIAYGHTVLDLTDEPGDLCETAVLDINAEECTLLPLEDGRVWRWGDVTGDGEIKPDDILTVAVIKRKIALGYITLEEALAENPFYDVVWDGEIKPDDILAVVVIKRKIALGYWP